MKIAVTGAAGRLGRQVADRLRADGRDVVAIDLHRRSEGMIAADLRDPASCHASLAGVGVIIHLAGNLDNDAGIRAYEDNVAMNANVLRFATDSGVRKVIFASSLQVIGWRLATGGSPWGFQPAYLPLDEACPLKPATPYAESKIDGEELLQRYCRETGNSGIALRFPRLMTADDYLLWSRDLAARGLLWVALSYYDAARLIGRCLVTDLPGFHAYLPAGPDAPWGPKRGEFLRQHYPDVPCHTPVEEMPGLVDCRRLSAEVGWQPLTWEEQMQTPS